MEGSPWQVFHLKKSMKMLLWPFEKRFYGMKSSLAHCWEKARKYFSPPNLLTLYKAQIRPSLEYCSHIWGAAAPTTLSILDAVQRRAIRLIGDPALTCHLQPLSHRHAVGLVTQRRDRSQKYGVIERKEGRKRRAKRRME
nr:unnamed protein product [Callosobruchus chinensis]